MKSPSFRAYLDEGLFESLFSLPSPLSLLKLPIYLQVPSIKLQIWLFHVVVLLTTAKKWTKVKNARPARAKLLFLSTKYANF